MGGGGGGHTFQPTHVSVALVNPDPPVKTNKQIKTSSQSGWGRGSDGWVGGWVGGILALPSKIHMHPSVSEDDGVAL